MTYPLIAIVTPAIFTNNVQQVDYGLLWSYNISGRINGFSVSSDGSYIAAAYDNNLYFFNKEGKLLWNYKAIDRVSISSDGSYIAAAYDNNLYFFNKEGKLLWNYKTDSYVESLSISSDGSYIATGSNEDDNIYFFNKEGKLLWRYKTGSGYITSSVSVSSDGSYIAATSYDSIYFFDKEGKLLWNYKRDSYGYIVSASFSSNGSYIVAGSVGGSVGGGKDNIYFFNKEGRLLWSYGSDVESLSISSDGSYIAAGSGHIVYLFNKKGKLLWNYKTDSYVESLSISSDGSYIAAGSGHIVYLFNKEGKLLWSYETGGNVGSLFISSDGSYIAAESDAIYFFVSKQLLTKIAAQTTTPDVTPISLPTLTLIIPYLTAIINVLAIFLIGLAIVYFARIIYFKITRYNRKKDEKLIIQRIDELIVGVKTKKLDNNELRDKLIEINKELSHKESYGTSYKGYFFAVALVLGVLLGIIVLAPSLTNEAENVKLTPTPPPDIQKNFTNSIGMEFVQIPAGEFDMGVPWYKIHSNPETPVHHVKISNAFYIGKYEVTQKQWHDVMGTSPSYFKGDKLPVESVSWNDAQEFIKKLNEKEGTNKYRLPSEAEWEYAVRASTATKYSFGDDESKLREYAWYDANSGSMTHEVGQKKPNTWGLYDMHGNVWEFVQDTWHNDYKGAPTDGSAWEIDGSNRVDRGGSWNCDALFYCRSAVRGINDPGYGNNSLGFRLVMDLPAPNVTSTVIQTPTPTLTPIPASTPTLTPITYTNPQKTVTNSAGMEFVLIPAGEFDMGSPPNEAGRDDDEGPVHRVKIAKAFYMGKYEVTQKQWHEIMGNKNFYFKGDNLPVENVSWNDVQIFMKKLNERENTDKYRLPSEAEWEYAARAGTTTRYFFGDNEFYLSDFAWYSMYSEGKTHAVNQKKPNSWGLYDVYGNVWELVQDIYHDNYNGAPTNGSVWGGVGSNHVIRGGSWDVRDMACRSAKRGATEPVFGGGYEKSYGSRSSSLGFRLVRDL